MKSKMLGLSILLITLGPIAAQCGPAPTPETVTVVETVVVEKEVEVEVEKEVVVTQEVEVVVEKEVEVEVQVEVTPVPLTKLNVCFSAASGTMSPAWYAFENGLFTKYGLDVNLTYIASGSRAATAMIAGDVEFCQIAGSAVTNAVVAGEDLVMIGGLFNTYVYSLMVTPDIQTPEDLKGKAVAISRAGSSSDSAIRAALGGLGLIPDEEVAVMAIGGQAERLAAMETGAVVGTVVSVPETREAKELGYSELLDMSTLGIPFQHTGIATSRSYLEANHEVVVNFMKAMTEAVSLMKQDKEGTMAVMADYLLLDIEDDAPSLEEAYDVLIQGYLPQAPYPSVDGVKVLLDGLVEENPEAANVQPEDVADTSIVQEIEDSGFIDELY